MVDKPSRKLFTTGEILTLAGVVLVVMSAAMTWANVQPKTDTMVAAAYVAAFQRNAYLTTGYGLKVGGISVGWVVVIAALGAGSLLLFSPKSGGEQPFMIAQVALGLVVLAIGIRYAGAYAGVAIAIVGAALIIAGALFRYKHDSSRSGRPVT